MVVQREDGILPGQPFPACREVPHQVRELSGEVVDPVGVLVDVVELPLGVLEGRTGPVVREDLPPVAAQATVAAEFGVLLRPGGRVGRVPEQRSETHPVDVLHRNTVTGPVDRRRMGDAHQVEDRRGEVRGILVLVTQSTRSQARGPAQQQRHTDAPGEGLSLVEAERGVGRHAPALRILRHRPWPTDERGIPVDVRGQVLRQPRHMVEATEVGAGAFRTAFRGAAVVGCEDDEGVVLLPQIIEKIDDSRQ